jgi:hypothetical protein
MSAARTCHLAFGLRSPLPLSYKANLRQKLGIPVEIVHPTVVQVAMRIRAPGSQQLLERRLARQAERPHPQGIALARVARHAAVTMFDQVVCPPRERGIACSNVSADDANALPQYWQAKRSRRNTLKRVKARRRAADWYVRRATTDGSRISVYGLWAHASYSATTTVP